MGPPPGITWMSVATVLVSAAVELVEAKCCSVAPLPQAGTGQFPHGSQPWLSAFAFGFS